MFTSLLCMLSVYTLVSIRVPSSHWSAAAREEHVVPTVPLKTVKLHRTTSQDAQDQWYPLVIKHGNGTWTWTIWMNDFPIKTSIYSGISIAMFDYQRVIKQKSVGVLSFVSSGFRLSLCSLLLCNLPDLPEDWRGACTAHLQLEGHIQRGERDPLAHARSTDSCIHQTAGIVFSNAPLFWSHCYTYSLL